VGKLLPDQPTNPPAGDRLHVSGEVFDTSSGSDWWFALDADVVVLNVMIAPGNLI
jgi:hypothetical protein